MPMKRIDKFFKPGTPTEKKAAVIVEALEFYQRNKSKQRKKDSRDER